MLQFPRSILLAAALFASQTSPVFIQAAPDATAKTPEKTIDDSDDKVVDGQPATAKTNPATEKYWQAIKLLNSKQGADLPKGREALQAAADLEYPHAQSFLAECLMTGGYGFARDKRKAANLYRLAAERGNAFAQVSLGQCYFAGTGVRKDRDKAAAWLIKAIDDKANFTRPTPPSDYLTELATKPNDSTSIAGELEQDAPADCRATAHYLLGVIATSDKKLEEAQKHYIEAASAGVDGRSGIYLAAVQAALNYAFGRGTARDMVKANEMLAVSRKLTMRAGVRMIHQYTTLKVLDDFAAGDLEDSIADEGEKLQTNVQFEIANSFTNKSSKDYNLAEAAKWYELAADSGNVWSMLKLAFLFSGADLGKPDPEKAFIWFDKAGGGDTPKHFLATANLAICYFNGIGTPKDVDRAAALFKKFKDSDFICYLGTLGQCPTTIVTWEQRIKLIETWAKTKKDPQAQHFFAVRYKNGWDVPVDQKKAIQWFTKAAKAGHGASWTELGMLHEYRRELFSEHYDDGVASALECYKKAAEAGEVNGTANYANMLKSGTGTDPDGARAERLYLHCLEIDPNHARSHNNLASIYENRLCAEGGLGPGDDYTTLRKAMLDHYEAAVRLEFPYAARNLGRVYSEGVLVDRDLRKSFGYYEKAAEWGLPETHFILGQMLEKGEGVPVTFSEAAYHYRLAALEGSTPALRQLIQLYLSGRTGTQDLDRALFWLNRLASAGDVTAFVTMVDVLFAKKEYGPAVGLLKEMADMQSSGLAGFACERLSRCYVAGLGVKADSTLAKKYFDRAVAANNCDALARLGLEEIDQGKIPEAIGTLKRASDKSPAACYFLGQLYFFGTHIEKDQTQALQLMRRAADQNHFEALYFLAGATFNKVSGAPTIEEAIRMASQAEAGGLEKAKVLREKLERRLNKNGRNTPEESAKARTS